jgi:hypothetical protein
MSSKPAIQLWLPWAEGKASEALQKPKGGETDMLNRKGNTQGELTGAETMSVGPSEDE